MIAGTGERGRGNLQKTLGAGDLVQAALQSPPTRSGPVPAGLLADAGNDVFTWNSFDLYGTNQDELVVWNSFLDGKLDVAEHKVQLRLGSTALQAKNVRLADGKSAVDVTYIKEGKLHRVRAKQSVMAGYNMMIPYMVPEMAEPQKEALRQNAKAPLVYTKVVIKNWQAFVKLGVHEVYSPAAPYSRVKLDYPVSMGGYEHPKSPDQPMCLHMVYVPTLPGSGLKIAGLPISFDRQRPHPARDFHPRHQCPARGLVPPRHGKRRCGAMRHFLWQRVMG